MNWRCPRCGASPLNATEESLTCFACEAEYPVIAETPVLLRPDNPLFPPDAYSRDAAVAGAGGRLRRLLPAATVNLSYERSIERLAGLVADHETPRLLLVGSGRQRTGLEALLRRAGRESQVTAVDVDVRADVDAWCDAHDLPFVDDTFDAVVATAVLEHVMHPERVMAEIVRVLKPGGLLYSEIPFMQQVHEGAYDFTRYTLSGHRCLANRFEELDSGMTAGPGSALGWAIEHFAASLFRPPRLQLIARAAVRYLFFWLKHTDRLIGDRPAAVDAASCTYLLGRLRAEGTTADAEIINAYTGPRRVEHV